MSIRPHEAQDAQPQPEGSDPKDGTHYGYYAIACVDVLGQSQALMELATLPHNPEAEEQVTAALQRSAGIVRDVRHAFERFVDEVRTAPTPSETTSQAAAHFLGATKTFPIRHIGFSDTFVVAIPLHEGDYGPVLPASWLFVLLWGLAGLMLEALADGIVLRAGVEVERATDLFPGEAYGPALVVAHKLESAVADYPRAVVGTGLLSYLDHLERLDLPGSVVATTRFAAARCREVLCLAPDDGRYMLNILAPIVQDASDAPLATRAYKWVRTEHSRLASAGDVKLAERYRKLLELLSRKRFRLTWEDGRPTGVCSRRLPVRSRAAAAETQR